MPEDVFILIKTEWESNEKEMALRLPKNVTNGLDQPFRS